MAGVGGSRPGAGRPAGSANKRTSELLAEAEAAGTTPVGYMLSILTNVEAGEDKRAWAAEKAAPYLHARPAPQPRTVIFELPDTETPAGMVKAASAILSAAADGTLAPSEAQSLMSVLEMQRKVVETVDILARLEALEGRGGNK